MGRVTANLSAILDRLRVAPGQTGTLRDADPRGTPPPGLDKRTAGTLIEDGVRRLSRLQELLYANASWSLLVVVQAMDAAGKDGTIKHVMSGVNPQGVAVTAFKAPGPEALAHDCLWRAAQAAPAKGMIGIFNRSHYEEVLVARVHPDVLERQHLPRECVDHPDFWSRRLAAIAAFERHLNDEGTRILKFFLHVSRDEQKRRLLARLDQPEKTWKFDAGDLTERGNWPSYMAAYEAALTATSTVDAPWYVIPADRKWFMRLLVVRAINDELTRLDLKPVLASPAQAAGFEEARRALQAEP